MATGWTHRHILSLANFTPADYDTVLQTAASFQEVLSRRTKKVPALQGQVVANLFFEASTRTRNSFELAAKRLSADTLNFAPGTSSLTKGETILDTALTYLAMGADIMVIRHREAGVPQAIAAEMERQHTQVSILNAGDGQHEHPSQALLDLFTLCTLLDPTHPQLSLLAGKKIAIVGDILHSRVARSNLWSLTASGAEVHLAAPPTLLPKGFADYVDQRVQVSGDRLPGTGDRGQGSGDRVQVSDAKFPDSPSSPHPLPSTLHPLPSTLHLHWSLAPALEAADFVMTLRLQRERMTDHLLPSLREYHREFGITHDRLKLCKPGVRILHPGPVNRGVELSSELMDDPAVSLISQQVTSGVAIRMALLYLIGSSKTS